ncbi:MAG: hypothetical protein ILO36_06395 [Abditibacteriota bacterium]|nr:hypothetical protein [Abditibacteriota bacterium]
MKNLFLFAVILLFAAPLWAKTAWFAGGDACSGPLMREFSKQGFETRALADLSLFKGGKNDVLVLENCERFPCEAADAFGSFIKSGGGLLAIGGVPFSELTVRLGESDIPVSRLTEFAASEGGETLADPAVMKDTSRFDISSAKALPGRHLELSESEGRPAFHLFNDGADSWERYALPVSLDSAPENPFFVISIKGSRLSPALSLGITEKDGSRWFRHFALSEGWQTFTVSPREFGMWDNSKTGDRGGSGDMLRPAEIASFEFSIMSSVQEEEEHPSSTPTGKPQDIYIGALRLVSGSQLPEIKEPAEMPAFYPAMHMYKCSCDTIAFGGGTIKAPEAVMPLYRNLGYGLRNKGPFRQVPLAMCMENGKEKGMAAQAVFHREDSPFNGGVWVFAGVSPELLAGAPGLPEKLADCFAQKPRLLCAGTSSFSYMPGEKIAAGAKAAGGEGTFTNIRISDENGRAIFEKRIKTGSEVCFSIKEPGLYKAEASLEAGGKTVDAITQPFSVFDPRSRTRENSVRSENGHLWIGNEKWVPVGVNYWPMYASGVPLRTAEGGGAWLQADAYLPDRIEADLRLLKEMNVNTVSTQYLGITEAPQLRDFLERCEKYGIKVHLFVNGCHPLDIKRREAGDMVKAACLGRARAMFCYDLGWEVSLGGEGSRRFLNEKWNRWLAREYGSPEKAFTILGAKPSLTDGFYNGPSDRQIREPEKKDLPLIAAYRRFMDDVIGKGLQETVANLRKYDPWSCMGLRNGAGGNGTVVYAHIFPYDMKSGARHLDISCPEGYNLGQTPLHMGMGELTNLHCRMVSGGKPVVWIEYGAYLFLAVPQNEYRQEKGQKRLKYQENYYRTMADFVARSSATGSYTWWYPGGYRIDERSDYGIAEPDLTPRGALLAIRDRAEAQREGDRDPQPADETLVYDRDAYARGYGDFFEKYAMHVSERLAAGKYTRVISAGAGLTTAYLEPEGVGNIPYRGTGPVKYLDSETDCIKACGQTLLSSGDLRLRPGSRITVRMANTDDCLWENEGKGRVLLRVSRDGAEEFYPLDRRVGYLETGEASFVLKGRPSQIALRLYADGIGAFGEEDVIKIKWTE